MLSLSTGISWMGSSLHEVLHHTHQKKKIGVVLKLDVEKAYDKINWDSLLDAIVIEGLGLLGVAG